MTFQPELLDELLKEYKNPEDLLGRDGLLKQLSAALVEPCLNAEMDHHLEEERNEPESEGTSRNRRNGHSKKTLKGEFGEAEISFPVTETARLSQSSSRSMKPASTASTARFYRCTRGV
jgi:putative transposase